MTSLALPATKSDPRIDALCSPAAEIVFGTVVHPGSVWRTDPFDVETIHSEARETFTRLLLRATGPNRPDYGRIFLVRGTSGSGKTHLLRAFRNDAHTQGGYAGYLQMISQAGDYTRYVLAYLIDALDQPYMDQAGAAPGLLRLARCVLDSIGSASADEKLELCDAALDPPGIVQQVELLANFAVQEGRYDDRDLDLIRALLFLLSTDRRMKSRVMKWLRCEELTPADRELLGGLATQTLDGAPLRVVAGLGRVMAVLGSPLVLLIDQLEETFDLTVEERESGRRFRQAVDALVNIAAHVPNAVVVVACLDRYYESQRQMLPEPKLHRLEMETPPVTLGANRDEGEIGAILERRLQVLCGQQGCPIDESVPLFPFRQSQLAPLAGQTIRKVLLDFHQHIRRCREVGEWVEPTWSVTGTSGRTDGPSKVERTIAWAQQWNDFLSAFSTPILDDEPELADLLAFAIRSVSSEMSNGTHFGPDRDGRCIAVDVNLPGNASEQLYVAVCDRNARGGGLKRQIEEVAKNAGETPAVFVRSTPFPNSPQADVTKQLAKLLAPRGTARRVVVSNSDWRALAAFRAFIRLHPAAPGFAQWQQSERPLSALAAVTEILSLDNRSLPQPLFVPPAPPLPPEGKPKEITPTVTPQAPVTKFDAIRFGLTRSAVAAPVELQPKSMCRHAAFLGSPGSGKTTAALTIIEQLLLSGIPTVVLDRKGDLARYADPTAWTAPEANSDRAARRAQLQEAIDVVLYTPGADRGRPLAISVVPSDLASAPTADREQTAQFAAAGLGVMMGYKSRTPDPKLVILQKGIETLAAAPGQTVSVRAIQRLVADQDEALLAQFDGQFEAKHFKNLATDLLTLSLQHRRLLDGAESLDVDALLGRGTGAVPSKTRLSVINTQFLGDATTTDFWVSQLLLAVDRWRAKNPAPEGALQAAFLFDEADLYLPAVGKPATKGPMESLLRRARSAGIGLFLATQSPGDLDYRCRDQILTWLIGRVKEPVAIGKLKPMLEAKPGAADKLAEQKAGEFYLVREGDIQPVNAARNLIATEQLPEDRILALARGKSAV